MKCAIVNGRLKWPFRRSNPGFHRTGGRNHNADSLFCKKKRMQVSRNISMVAGICLVILSGCVKSTTSSTTTVGNWVRSSDFEGKARTEAIAATASNGKVYVGLGFDGT